jgi:hypothetical protein
LVLHLAGDAFRTAQVKEKSDFLKVERVDYHASAVSFTYRQSADVEQWAMISSVYLGNIEITTGNMLSSLCVLLSSTNPYKEDVITAVNPVGQTLKIEPHKVIEVVVFGGAGDQWDCVVEGRDLQVEGIGHREVTLDFVFHQRDFNHVFCAYPRQDFKNLDIREYHYWFRLSKQSVEEIQKLYDGVYSGGQVVFFNHLEETNRLDLAVNVRKKNRGKNYNALYCSTQQQPTNYLPRPIPNRNSINRRTGPFISEVQLQEIKDCTLESNCRVLYLDCY